MKPEQAKLSYGKKSEVITLEEQGAGTDREEIPGTFLGQQ